MSALFIVFYRRHGEDYSAPFNTMRKARQFARLTGGRIESRLTSLLGKTPIDHARIDPIMII